MRAKCFNPVASGLPTTVQSWLSCAREKCEGIRCCSGDCAERESRTGIGQERITFETDRVRQPHTENRIALLVAGQTGVEH